MRIWKRRNQLGNQSLEKTKKVKVTHKEESWEKKIQQQFDWKAKQKFNEENLIKKEDKRDLEMVKARLEQDILCRNNEKSVFLLTQIESSSESITIQFVISGEIIKQNFSIHSSLHDLENFVKNYDPNIGEIVMTTLFPMYVHNPEDYHLTLLEAGLTGRTKIIVQPQWQ